VNFKTSASWPACETSFEAAFGAAFVDRGDASLPHPSRPTPPRTATRTSTVAATPILWREANFFRTILPGIGGGQRREGLPGGGGCLRRTARPRDTAAAASLRSDIRTMSSRSPLNRRRNLTAEASGPVCDITLIFSCDKISSSVARTFRRSRTRRQPCLYLLRILRVKLVRSNRQPLGYAAEGGVAFSRTNRRTVGAKRDLLLPWP